MNVSFTTQFLNALCRRLKSAPFSKQLYQEFCVELWPAISSVYGALPTVSSECLDAFVQAVDQFVLSMLLDTKSVEGKSFAMGVR